MRFQLDPHKVSAIFTLPRSGGDFDPDFAAYLQQLGQKRPSVLFFFPPKAAGTFLRVAAIAAVGGQLARIVHAFGGREATPYLPTFIRYLSEEPTDPVMVSHVHMQAFPANTHFIEALDLKPVIMLRSVPDMLCSFLDMLNSEPITPELWINSMIPKHFTSMSEDAQADFIVDIMGPWYASYFATWLDYLHCAPSRVCVLRYPEFKRDPAAALETLLRHSRLEQPRERCVRAIDSAWRERASWRFNKGEQGRGRSRFRDHHLARLETLLFRHYQLESFRGDLMPV